MRIAIMQFRTFLVSALLVLASTGPCAAQTATIAATDDSEQLKLAALEALVAAPPQRALPLVSKVLDGNHSDAVKSRALFVLSQIDHPDAQARLLAIARSGNGELRIEAVRMIGVSGETEALAALAEIYAAGDTDLRHAILEAYVIADDSNALYEIAAATTDAGDFAHAVEMLGAMGARDELRKLRDKAGISESLINAYAIAGDVESLRELALDGSDEHRQQRAIEALGIVGGAKVNTILAEIYRGAASDEVRDAAVQGFIIAGNDAGLLDLYRGSKDNAEKRRLLEALSIVGGDLVLEVIDAALAEEQ
jgi:HEAT repeat protein